MAKATPKKLLVKVLEQKKCVLYKTNQCEGDLTVEHTYGRQKQRQWQLVRACQKHHGLGKWWSGHNKMKDALQLFALLQATDEDLKEYSPKLWQQYTRNREYLKQKYKHLL